jgi:maltooligosyltrehalose trehalohydrolase
MGQEYDETHPFLFFTSFGDPVLHKTVAEGRRKEFAQFGFADTPDPEDPQSFERSKLQWQPGNEMWEWYRRLLELRCEYVMHAERKCDTQVENGILTMRVGELVVQATLKQGAKLPPAPAAGKTLLEPDEDGYAVRVLATSH